MMWFLSWIVEPWYWFWCWSLCKRRGWLGYAHHCPRCDRGEPRNNDRQSNDDWDW